MGIKREYTKDEIAEQKRRESEIEKAVSNFSDDELKEFAVGYIKRTDMKINRCIKNINKRGENYKTWIERYNTKLKDLEELGLDATKTQKENYQKALEGRLND